VWGWDLARATDWTWGIALCGHGRVCRSERWNQSSITSIPHRDHTLGTSHPEYWDLTIRRVQTLTGAVPALVDSTGPGGPIDQALAAGHHRNFEGYVFTSRSKQQLMEGLAVAVQRREVGFPDDQLVLELESFEYEYTRLGVKYSAPEGMHDDGVCALALAWHKFTANRLGREVGADLAGMIRTGQQLHVLPNGAPAPGPSSLAEWMRSLK
jgi:hypothetical protein